MNSTPSAETVLTSIESEGAVLTITLNRPARKNALTLAMYDQLTASLKRAIDDPEIRAVILRGAEGSFTSGNDLMDFMKSPPQSIDTPVFHFLKALLTFPKPLIAAVSGPAIGIGTTLLLHCDFVYADEHAIFQLPFIRLGLVPEAGASLLLPRLAGHRRAAELLMLGEKFSATEALEIGLINERVESDQLFERAHERAEALSKLPPEAMRQTKELLKAPLREELTGVMLREGEVFMNRLTSPETAEAIQAFFMKRPADFSRFS